MREREERNPTVRSLMWTSLILAVLAAIVTACAATSSKAVLVDTHVKDLRAIAGSWRGYVYYYRGERLAQPAEVSSSISEDGRSTGHGQLLRFDSILSVLQTGS